MYTPEYFYNVLLTATIIIAIIGNIIPVFLIIFCLDSITKWSYRHSHFLTKILDWTFKKTRKKTSEKIKKYGSVALFLFVAIPLPGTGAWTGSIAAWLFNIPFKKAIIPITLGIITAGIITTLITLGIISSFAL